MEIEVSILWELMEMDTLRPRLFLDSVGGIAMYMSFYGYGGATGTHWNQSSRVIAYGFLIWGRKIDEEVSE